VTQSAAQADAFYTEAIRTAIVWTLRDEHGFPAPRGDGEQRVQPFWSSRSRAERIISAVEAYRAMEPVEIPLAEWRDRWLPGLERDGMLVGLNWSGDRATGFDVTPTDVARALEARQA
jgi:hypothetical protein